MRYIIPISGKDSLCTALVQTAKDSTLPYEYLFTDNGSELPETYKWLNQVEKTADISITRIEANLTEIIKKQKVLPSSKMRYCTRLSKIKPMEKYLGKEAFTLYVGLRADEPQRVGYESSQAVTKFPLRESGVTLAAVFAILKAKDLLPPSFFYQPLFDATDADLKSRLPLFLKTGLLNWESFISEFEHRQLFAGRTRSNCYFCFYQRLIEFIWLHDTHPDLFEKAVELEESLGSTDYTWKQGYKLRELPNQRDRIIRQRAKKVADYIEARINGAFLTIELDSELTLTSCGLLCGK